MRAISTVLDVSLFLLLVGAAVATVALSTAPSVDGPVDATDPADEVAETFGTSTARVDYSLGPGLVEAGEIEPAAASAPILDRSDHGSYAALVAEGAVADASLAGDPLTAGAEAYQEAVRAVVERPLRRSRGSASVRATWTPYPDAPVAGTYHAGGTPPPNVDVRSATLTVDSSYPDARAPAVEAAGRDGYDGVAAVLANATVRGLFPERATRLGTRAGYPTAHVIGARYRKADSALGGVVSLPDEMEDFEVARANAAVESALRERFVADLSSSYSDPESAARDVRIGSVTVVVRTWSR